MAASQHRFACGETLHSGTRSRHRGTPQVRKDANQPPGGAAGALPVSGCPICQVCRRRSVGRIGRNENIERKDCRCQNRCGVVANPFQMCDFDSSSNCERRDNDRSEAKDHHCAGLGAVLRKMRLRIGPDSRHQSVRAHVVDHSRGVFQRQYLCDCPNPGWLSLAGDGIRFASL